METARINLVLHLANFQLQSFGKMFWNQWSEVIKKKKKKKRVGETGTEIKHEILQDTSRAEQQETTKHRVSNT